MIHLKNISKSFGQAKVIDNVNLHIKESETHVLLGTSGCGKTTLLRMICNLVSPDEGEVIVDGKNIGSYSRKERSDLIGYVVQEGGLFPHLSAKENILLASKVRGLDLTDSTNKMHEFAHMVHLQLSLLDKFPHQLSGGQRQRVALMRGLMLNPKVILLDEPLSALDPVVRMNLQKELKEIFNNLNKTVVMVTHDLHEASYLADKITIVDKGRIVQQGQFEEILKAPKNNFVEDFLNAQVLRV